MRYILIFLFLLSIFFKGFAQNEFSSEQELREKADEYLLKEEFAKAIPLYSQLLSLYPKDPLYNYLFGICTLYGDRRDPEKSIKYLLYAKDNLVGEVNVWYYLAEAYHLNYRFEEAIDAYNTYKNMAPARSVKQFDVIVHAK